MRYSVSIPAGMSDRLTEVAELLRGCREAFLRIRDDHHWVPSESSSAAVDLTEIGQMDGVRDERVVLEMVAAYLELAVGNCAGLAALYEAVEVVTSPAQLVRAVLEDCARAYWLIGSDPVSAPEDRLARSYIDHEISAVDKQKYAARLMGKTSFGYALARSEFKDLRAEIKKAFPATSGTDFDAPVTINGQKNIGPTETVKWFYALRRGEGGSDIGEGIYIRLCNQTHPTISSIRDRRRFIRHGEHFGSHQVVKLSELENLARLAVSAVHVTLAWVYRYCGWDFDPDHEFEDLIERTFPGSLADIAPDTPHV
ncbi:hypothetical protein ABZ412_13755 [Nocardia sp. NPDC005746]|uniref:hypothetical protein n=1 Tax=Nocardia sp. NPDC005746 TaxID=3157062 RepID=UPI0033E126E9